jgi:hypothetical protein
LGTQLTIGVVRYYNPDNFPLRISRGTVIEDPTTGARLTVRDVSPPAIATGGQAQQWFTVEVTRESTNDLPGAFTIDGITLFGHVYRGERYFLVVSGPAIAENHFGVLTHAAANATTPFSRGIHLTPPFAVEIIDLTGEFDVGDRADSLDGVTFTTGVAFRGVANPIIWRRLPGMQHEGGFVSMRAFALAAGIDEANISWASRVATISGVNYQGQTVVVSVTPDSNRATIVVDGIPSDVDIAMMADGLTGPDGTVRPVHEAGTIYLPLRFMFNVFGYTDYYNLVRQGQSAVITAR